MEENTQEVATEQTLEQRIEVLEKALAVMTKKHDQVATAIVGWYEAVIQAATQIGLLKLANPEGALTQEDKKDA